MPSTRCKVLPTRPLAAAARPPPWRGREKEPSRRGFRQQSAKTIPMAFDTIIRGGRSRPQRHVRCDVGISGGRIAALGENLGDGRRDRRCARPAGAARRHRQPRPYRPAVRPRHRHGRRLRLRHALRRLRRQHHGAAVRHAAEGRKPARGGEGLSRQGRRPLLRRRLVPSDHRRRDRARARPGAAGAGQRRLHLVQGVHDLRGPRAVRHGDAQRHERGARDRRAGDGARRELRRHPLPHRSAGARGQDRAALPRRVAARSRSSARRRTAPSHWPRSSMCRS